MTCTGKFITIEGGEGVGKSTNIATVENFLLQRGIPFIRTREPGGTPLAEQLRELLLMPRDEVVDEKTELLLMFAARAQHLQQKILPALHEGKWVICDRFTDATYAYQGGGRGLSVALIAELESIVHGNLQPDLTLLLDVDIKTGLQRAGLRSAPDRFEREQQDFFERVRNAYLERARQFPGRFAVIDAGQTLASVQTDIVSALDCFVERTV